MLGSTDGFPIDAYASLSHYAAHIKPIFDALPSWARGEFYAARGDSPWMTATMPGRVAMAGKRLLLVASYTDAHKFGHRPCVLVEHGAGQDYRGDERAARSPSYSGGDALTNVVMFIAPREDVAARWRARYPRAEAVVVGCPRLDQWHRTPATWLPEPKDVAVTWHWEAELIPETKSAWRHYAGCLAALRGECEDNGHSLIGHAHPRMWGGVRRAYEMAGIEFVESIDEVFVRARMLIGDNTSALPEFASLDRPVIWLNAPWYRRNVWHGGRFWDWPGRQACADDPAALLAVVALALKDPPRIAQDRRAMVKRVYAHTDGNAATRAVQAIVGLAG